MLQQYYNKMLMITINFTSILPFSYRFNVKLTCRQHCGALKLEKPPALMWGRAFQKSPAVGGQVVSG